MKKKLYNVCQLENKTGLKIVLNTFENLNDALERTCYLNINNRSNGVSYITEGPQNERYFCKFL